MRLAAATLAALIAAGTAASAQDARMRFINKTSHIVSGLYLAPAGTQSFGPNQCKNDRDGTVDPDERLRIVGVKPGKYDVRVETTKGKRCIARGVDLTTQVNFTLTDADVAGCN